LSRRLIDYDPFTGIAQYFHYDGATDSFVLEDVQDVEANIEAARAQFNAVASPRERWGDIAKVAHIPNVVLQQLMIGGKLWDQAFMKRWLNDPDNAVFRTRPGTV